VADAPVRKRREPVRAWLPGALALTWSVAVGLLSLVMRAQVPVVAAYQRYDDSLFVRLAQHLIEHHWLGPFDRLTLVKSPGYPLFVAVNAWLGIPLQVGTQLIVLAGGVALATVVWVALRRPVPAALVFTVVALDPAGFSSTNAQIRRDGWYAALSVLVIVALALALDGALRRRGFTWPLWAGVAGLALGAFWLSQEVPTWILPGAGLVVLLAATRGIRETIRARRRPGTGPPPRPGWLVAGRLGLVGVLVGGVAAAPVGLVVDHNCDCYGVCAVNQQTTEIARAYNTWASVDVGEPQRYVTITRGQREAVYAVSPHAAELRPHLENPRNTWLRHSSDYCDDLGICGDFASWWEQWAVIEAAEAAGHFHDGAESERFFASIRVEIEQAFADGRLERRRPIPMMPGVSTVDVADTARATWRGTVYAITASGLVAPERPDWPVFRKAPEERQVMAQAAAADVVRGVPVTLDGARAEHARFTRHRAPYQALATASPVVVPLLVLLGLLGLIASLATRQPGDVLRLAAFGLLASAAVRLLMLGLFDATLLPGASERLTYQQSSRALLVAFGLLGTAQLFQVLAARRNRGPAVRPESSAPEDGTGPREETVEIRDGGDGSLSVPGPAPATAG
jgi:hypothetical protein